MIKKILFLSSVCLLVSASFAKADAIGTTSVFQLTLDACSGTCGTSPFGTITLVQTATGVVTVTETLKATSPAEGFVATGAGKSLDWNLTGDPSITIGFLTSGFGVTGATSASAFGSFEYSVSCATISCGPGASVTNPGPLSFTVTDGTGVNVSDFIGNAGGFFFASDIIGANGNTGNVGSGSGTTPPPPPPPPPATTPEPSSLLLFGTGLAAAAGLARRRIAFAVKGN